MPIVDTPKGSFRFKRCYLNEQPSVLHAYPIAG